MRSEHRAAQFVARLYSGDMTEQDEQALHDWLSESEANLAEYQAALETWDRAEALASRLPEVNALARTDAAIHGRWPGLAIAASILLFVAIGLVSWGPGNFWSINTGPADAAIASYTTGLGQQKTISLPDGSTVSLNTETRVLVDFSTKRRRAILEYGEAWFDIARDPEKPFTVDTGSRAITVLGTQFNVYKSSFKLNVEVIEGMVAVHRPEDIMSVQTPAIELQAETATLSGNGADQYLIGAGVAATFSGVLGDASAEVQTSPIEDMDKYPFWRSGQMRFDQQPLYQVIKEINRYSSRKVLIEDKAVMDIPVSGVFNINEIDTALNSFEMVLPLRMTHYADRVVIVGK